MQTPLISVIMPVYNTAKYLNEAIDSILEQTFKDFEFIIIDDCSTDGSKDIIKSYNDERIILLENETNLGIVYSLNYAISLANGKYIARMDSDDISEINRLEKQVSFMENNEDIILCGTWFKGIGNDKLYVYPESHDEIIVKMLSYCAIGHPTVFIRNSILKHYNLKYDILMEYAEDYDLWSRLSTIGKLANLPEVLLQYRIHDNQVSKQKKIKQKILSDNIRLNILRKLDQSLSLDLYSLNNFDFISFDIFNALENRLITLDNLLILNSNKNKFNKLYFSEFIKYRKTSLINDFLIHSSAFNYKIMFKVIFKINLFIKNAGIINSFKYLIKTFLKIKRLSFYYLLFF